MKNKIKNLINELEKSRQFYKELTELKILNLKGYSYHNYYHNKQRDLYDRIVVEFLLAKQAEEDTKLARTNKTAFIQKMDKRGLDVYAAQLYLKGGKR